MKTTAVMTDWHIEVSGDGTELDVTDAVAHSSVEPRVGDRDDAMPLRRTPTDVRELLPWSLEALRRQAEARDVALKVQVEEDVPAVVSLDRTKIAWVITALVGNALRYVRRGSQTMPGGSIVVRATYDPASREVTIGVQDDGPGIPADKVQALFSADPRSPGMALGLTMIRDVVAAHHGTVTVHSDTKAHSRGTTVQVTLPVSA